MPGKGARTARFRPPSERIILFTTPETLVLKEHGPCLIWQPDASSAICRRIPLGREAKLGASAGFGAWHKQMERVRPATAQSVQRPYIFSARPSDGCTAVSARS